MPAGDYVLAYLGTILALIGTAVAIVLNIRKSRSDEALSRSATYKGTTDAEKAMMEAVGEVTESTLSLLPSLNNRIKELADEVTNLDTKRLEMTLKLVQRDEKIRQLEIQLAEQVERMNDMQRQLDKVKDWAQRLSGQIEAMGGTPVPLEADD